MNLTLATQGSGKKAFEFLGNSRKLKNNLADLLPNRQNSPLSGTLRLLRQGVAYKHVIRRCPSVNPPEPAIERLLGIDWFASVNRAINVPLPLTIETVSNWQSAITLRGKPESENAFLEARGRLTVALSANHRDSYRKWNYFVRIARETIDNEIVPNASARLPAQDDAEFVLGCVQWDSINYVMEYVYSDLISPTFYTMLYDVYEAGHFPCHWDEVWPDGRLWVV